MPNINALVQDDIRHFLIDSKMHGFEWGGQHRHQLLIQSHPMKTYQIMQFLKEIMPSIWGGSGHADWGGGNLVWNTTSIHIKKHFTLFQGQYTVSIKGRGKSFGTGHARGTYKSDHEEHIRIYDHNSVNLRLIFLDNPFLFESTETLYGYLQGEHIDVITERYIHQLWVERRLADIIDTIPRFYAFLQRHQWYVAWIKDLVARKMTQLYPTFNYDPFFQESPYYDGYGTGDQKAFLERVFAHYSPRETVSILRWLQKHQK